MPDNNPYAGVGQIAFGDRFVPRPGLTGVIEEAWRAKRPGNLNIRGNFRVGKSSLARNADVPAATSRVVVSGGMVDHGVSLVRMLTRRVHEVLRADGLTFAQLAEASKMLNWVFDSDSWIDVTEGALDFFSFVAQQGLSLVVVIDEFDRLSGTCGVPAFQFLRDIGSEPEFAIGLAAISRRPLHEIEGAGSAGSNLSGVFGQSATVGLLGETEVELMIERGEVGGFPTRDYGEELRAIGGSHAYLLEMALFEVCEMLRSAETPTVVGLGRRVRERYVPLAAQYATLARESFASEFRWYFDSVMGDRDLESQPGLDTLVDYGFARILEDGQVDALSPFFVGLISDAFGGDNR